MLLNRQSIDPSINSSVMGGITDVPHFGIVPHYLLYGRLGIFSFSRYSYHLLLGKYNDHCAKWKGSKTSFGFNSDMKMFFTTSNGKTSEYKTLLLVLMFLFFCLFPYCVWIWNAPLSILYFVSFFKIALSCVLLVRWRSRHVVPATSEQLTKQEASATRHVGERSASWVWRPRWTLRRLLKSLFWQTKHSRTLTDSFQMIQCCLET